MKVFLDLMNLMKGWYKVCQCNMQIEIQIHHIIFLIIIYHQQQINKRLGQQTKNGNFSFSSCNLDKNIFIRNDSASIEKKTEFLPKTVFPFKKACLMHSLCTCSAVVHYHGCTVTKHLHKASIALPLSISTSITHTQTHTQTNTLSHLGTCAKLHIQDNKQGQS